MLSNRNEVIVHILTATMTDFWDTEFCNMVIYRRLRGVSSLRRKGDHRTSETSKISARLHGLTA